MHALEQMCCPLARDWQDTLYATPMERRIAAARLTCSRRSMWTRCPKVWALQSGHQEVVIRCSPPTVREDHTNCDGAGSHRAPGKTTAKSFSPTILDGTRLHGRTLLARVVPVFFLERIDPRPQLSFASILDLTSGWASGASDRHNTSCTHAAFRPLTSARRSTRTSHRISRLSTVFLSVTMNYAC